MINYVDVLRVVNKEYEDIMNYYPLSVEEFSSGINNYA